MTISLNQQIEEVQRELDQRAKVYPRLNAKGTLPRHIGDYQVQRLQAVRTTLQWLKENEKLIKSLLAKVAEERAANGSDDKKHKGDSLPC